MNPWQSRIQHLEAQITRLEAEKVERKQIEAALRDIEQRYATLVDCAPVGIFRTDLEGNYLYVNERWCTITGLTHRQAMGTGWLDGLHGDDRERLVRLWQQATQFHQTFRAEYRLMRSDDQTIWVVGEALEERDRAGNLLGYIGTVTDITERKQAEVALGKSEATNRALLNALPDMLFRLAPDGTYLDLVSRGELQPLLPLSELLGKRPNEVLPPEVARMAMQAIEQAIATNQIQTFEYCLAENDEDSKDYEARVVSIGGEEVLAIIRDITARKRAEAALQQLNAQLEARVERRTLALRESEERFRKIFEESPLGISLLDSNYQFLRVNRALCQILDYTEAELERMTCLEITHPDDCQKTQQLVTELLSRNLPSTSLEKRYFSKNGAMRWVHLTTTTIRQSDGQPLYVLAIIQDISDSKKAEEHLKLSLHDQELLLKEVHHRVKNNLQVISSLFSLQSQYLSNPNILAILTESQNRIESMALIHEKLYHSATLAKIDFADYIKTLVSHLLSSYNLHPQQIHLILAVENISLDLDTAIPCGLLLNELVSNALKHAFVRDTPACKAGASSDFVKRDKRRELNIQLTSQQQHLCLIVRDNGQGLPENLNLSAVKSLGLRLVRALSRQLKGQLTMFNDNGAVFKVIFPQKLG